MEQSVFMERVYISALVTARIGGIVYSATAAAMDQYGVSESSAVAVIMVGY